MHVKNIKDVDKLAYLIESLEGAFETVEGIGTTNINYPVAVNLLRERFGNKDRVVDAHYKALNNIEIAKNSASECRKNLNLVERHLRILFTLGQDTEGSHLRVTVSSKFPASVIYQVKLLKADSSMKELRATLDKVILAMERAEIPSIPSGTDNISTTEVLHINTHKEIPKERKDIRRKRNFNTRERSTASQPKRARRECAFCKEEHYSDQCKNYTTLDARKNQLKGVCYLCLKDGHMARKCRNKRNCVYCRKAHNRALCPKRLTVSSTSKPSKSNNSNTSVNTLEVDCFLNKHHSCLQTATAKLISNKTEIACRVLLDSGSQRSYLTAQAAKRLNLVTQNEEVLVIFTFGSNSRKKVPSTEINLITKRGVQRKLQVNIVPHISDRIPVTIIEPHDSIDLAADDESTGEGIDLLIGNDYYFSFIRNERIKFQENLYLINTDFGWIISGSFEETRGDNAMTIVTYCQCHSPGCPYFSEPDLPLRSIDTKFLWALESIGITDSPNTTREEGAVKHFNETVMYRNGRYEVKWPWIDFPPLLHSNFGMAYGRLKKA